MKKRDVVGNVLGSAEIGGDNQPNWGRLRATKFSDYRATNGRADAGQLMALIGRDGHDCAYESEEVAECNPGA
jgi:hypothetical protein